MDAANVSGQIQELKALRQQRRVWQIGATCAIVLIAILCLAKLRSSVTALAAEGPTQKAFVDDLGERMQTNVIPAVQEMASQALHEIDFGAEVKKLNRRTPEIAEESLKHLNLLSENLPKRGEKVWKATFETALKGREAKLKAMFPEITEEQTANVLANLTEEAQIQVVDINDTLFSKHQKALKEIESGIEHIRKTEPANAGAEPATWEMALMVFDIAREDLRALETKEKPLVGKGKNAKKGEKK
jgi:hypothetical protein